MTAQTHPCQGANKQAIYNVEWQSLPKPVDTKLDSRCWGNPPLPLPPMSLCQPAVIWYLSDQRVSWAFEHSELEEGDDRAPGNWE